MEEAEDGDCGGGVGGGDMGVTAVFGAGLSGADVWEGGGFVFEVLSFPNG